MELVKYAFLPGRDISGWSSSDELMNLPNEQVKNAKRRNNPWIRSKLPILSSMLWKIKWGRI
jgi:hypothetical protein